jgi:hypothetical protein
MLTSYSLNGFHYRHDLNRHKKKKHQDVRKGNIPQDRQPGVQRKAFDKQPRLATGRDHPSTDSTTGFQASANALTTTRGPFQYVANENPRINASHPLPSEQLLNEPLQPINPFYHSQANSYYHNELSLASEFSIPMRTSWTPSSNQATNDLPQLFGDSTILDAELGWLREYKPLSNSLQPHSNSDPLSHPPLTTPAHNEMDNLPHRPDSGWPARALQPASEIRDQVGHWEGSSSLGKSSQPISPVIALLESIGVHNLTGQVITVQPLPIFEGSYSNVYQRVYQNKLVRSILTFRSLTLNDT